jgi:hypothetical protein
MSLATPIPYAGASVVAWPPPSAQTPPPQPQAVGSGVPEYVVVRRTVPQNALCPEIPNGKAKKKSVGEYEKKVAIGLFSAAASLFFVLPLILEACETRPNALKHLLRERFEKAIQNGRCDGGDVALNWVRKRDTKVIDPKVVDAVAKHMYQAWTDFQRADKMHENNPTTASRQARENALNKVREFELPIIDKPGRKVALKTQELIIPNPDAQTRITAIYHTKLGELHDDGYRDGDTSRLAQAQCEAQMQKALGLAPMKAVALGDKNSFTAGRENEFANTKLRDLHTQGVREFLTWERVGRVEIPHMETVPTFEMEPSVTQRRIGNSAPNMRVDASRLPSPGEVSEIDKIAQNVARIRKERASGIARDFSKGALHAVEMFRNLAEGTMEAPKNSTELKKLLTGWQKSDKHPYRFSMCMSLRDIDYPHLGVGELAPHLHPNHDGMTTGSRDDQKQARVVWEFPAPKSGDLLPIDVRLAEGKLVAAWLTKHEAGCEGEIKKLERESSRVADALGGNKAALEKSMFKRVKGGLLWRYASLFRGMKEGNSNPRNIGRIAAVVLMFSAVVSMTIYGTIDAVHYRILKDEEKEHRLPGNQSPGNQGQGYQLPGGPANSPSPFILESGPNQYGAPNPYTGNSAVRLTA